MGKMKNLFKFTLNSIVFYCCRFFKSKCRFEKETVAVFADTLNVKHLLSSKSLMEYHVVLVVTKRFPFYSLIYNWKNIDSVEIVPDFGENNFGVLLDICQRFNVLTVLIQAGDFLVPAYNYVNRKIGGKSNSEEAVNCSLDKKRMRQLLSEFDISPIKMVEICDVTDLRKVDFFPAVLKPAIGTASEGVIQVMSPDELHCAAEQSMIESRSTDFEGSIIVEEYVKGKQYDVEGIVIDGRVVVLCLIAESYQGFFPYFNYNWYLFNIQNKQLEDRVCDLLERSFQACGLMYGAYHCEFRVDGDGDIKIIEFSNRMGGGFEEPISKLTGNNFGDLYVRSMLGKSLDFQENIGDMMLEKYFLSKFEEEKWLHYLNENRISFEYFSNIYRGTVGRVRIYTSNNNLKLIGDNFGLEFGDEIH